MRHAYVVTGELNNVVEVWYAVCHSIATAERLCYEAEDEDENPDRIYTWHPIIDEED